MDCISTLKVPDLEAKRSVNSVQVLHILTDVQMECHKVAGDEAETTIALLHAFVELHRAAVLVQLFVHFLLVVFDLLVNVVEGGDFELRLHENFLGDH